MDCLISLHLIDSMRRMNTVRFLIFLLLGTAPSIVFAQQFDVREFYQMETDLAAIAPGEEVYDQNGEVCALLKIEATQDDFTFDVGQLGVSLVTRKTAEWWVYVPHGVRRISISHPIFGIIRNYHFPEPLVSGRTYIMTLVVPESNRVYNSGKKQKVRIEIFPPEASVSINGLPVQQSEPGIIEQELVLGAYDLVAVADKYHEEKQPLILDNEKVKKEMVINMRPAYGWLKMSVGEDVSLFVDDVWHPIPKNNKVELPSGTHRVRLEKKYHRPYSSDVTINDTTDTYILPMFVVNFKNVEVESKCGGEIVIDGSRVGDGIWQGPLDYGTHVIECRKENHRTTLKTLSLDPHTASHIVLEDPEPITGSLHVSSTPAGSSIMVDGSISGITPDSFNLLIGEHDVIIQRVGYNPENRKVFVREGETTYLVVPLNNIFPVVVKSVPNDAIIKVDGRLLYTDKINLVSGDHTVQASRSGYFDAEKTITVKESGEEFVVRMKKRNYLPEQIYFGLGTKYDMSTYYYGAFFGANKNHFNWEIGYYRGISTYEGRYIPSVVDAKLGVACILGSSIRVTPQLGVDYVMISDSQVTSSSSKSPNAVAITGDVRFSVALSSSFELFAIPEYAFPVSSSMSLDGSDNIVPEIKNYFSGFRVFAGIGFFF